MTSLISINHKFMGISPKELVDLILKSKYTKGVEAYIDINEKSELAYLKEIVDELKKNDLILQIHGNVELDYEIQIEYIKLLEMYADYLNRPIVLTFHTIYDEDKEVSIEKTINYVSKIVDSIDNNKIIVCLENLNDDSGMVRLKKEEINTIILNDDRVFFTYDIGHIIADNGPITNLEQYLIDEIRNVHVHSNDNKGNDHMPICENDIHWSEIHEGLSFLKANKYEYNIVFEYALEYCKGDTTEERIKNYLDSIDYVSEIYGGK